MKTGIFSKGLIAAMLMATAVVFVNCNKDDDDNNATAKYSISGNASGSQMVPAVSGSGTGSISGTYDPSTHVLTYTTGWTSLTGVPTGGGFYAGAAGTNGTAVGTPWTFGTVTATGSFSNTMTLTDAQAAQLTSGGWYYTYTTATNSSGEVRGQIAAAQ